jgi:hypothetical protein
MSRRKPVITDKGYEISLVETPPPSPPDYQLIKSWSPKKYPQKIKQRPTASIIISVIALLIAIFSIIHVVFPSLFIGLTTTVTSTTTSTTQVTIAITASSTVTTTITSTTTQPATVTSPSTKIIYIPRDLMHCRFPIKLVNLTLTYDKNNENKLQLLFDVTISPQKNIPIDKKNFTVLANGNLNEIINTVEKISNKYRVNSTITIPDEGIYIIDIMFNISENESCTIARIHC